MDDDVLRDKVGPIWHAEVIHLLLANGFDGDDFIPVDVLTGNRLEVVVPKHAGIPGEPIAGQVAGRACGL